MSTILQPLLRWRYRWLALVLLLVGGCIEAYVPEVANAGKDYLVVSGFINSAGVTTIELSRSLKLSATTARPVEGRATVTIQRADGQRFRLSELTPGTYTSANLVLDPAQTYQLRITTTSGSEYATDLQAVKTTPPIDKLGWKFENNGVQIYLSAHDASRAATYYRWKYEETWQFTSMYNTAYQYNKTTKEIELRQDDIYHCWRTTSSTAITQTNTTRLSQDAVNDFPLVFLDAKSEKLPIKYSILVKQMAQSKEEYDYWETLKKNTESLGSINDPLPTQLSGNVHCLTDPAESVLGFVGVHSVAEKRLFIARNELLLPHEAAFDTGYDKCVLVVEDRCAGRLTPPPTSAVTRIFTGLYVPVSTSCDSASVCDFRTACAYYGAPVECVDCRLRGTNVKPSFWQ